MALTLFDQPSLEVALARVDELEAEVARLQALPCQKCVPGAEDCGCCGAHNVEHKHSLNAVMRRGIVALYLAGGSAHYTEMGLDDSEKANLRKFRYFGMIDPIGDHTGRYELTERGRDFVEGRLSVPKIAWTFRNVVQKWDGDHVFIHELKGGAPSYREWAAAAIPHNGRKP